MARKKSKTEEAKEKVSEIADEIVEAEVIEEIAAEEPVEDVVTDEPDSVELDEPTADAQEETSVEPQPEQVVVQRKGGFFPMLLGGVAAAGIGFGSALYLLPELPKSWLPESGNDNAELLQRLEAQDAALAELKAALASAGDDTALQDSVSATQASVEALAGDVTTLKGELAAVGEMQTRITALEKAPMADASPEAVAAYKREMEALQAALAKQRSEVEAMAAEAEQKNASAEMTAQDALKRSAVSQILTSLETGSGFGEAVESLTAAGATVPEALSAQAGGVPSIDTLKEGFAEPARAALATARKADGGGGLGGFLKAQLGARSLEPREGDDADAVLSRVEAAVKEGRLGDALAEAAALPDEAQAPLKDWTDAVKARQAAVEAAEALSQQINSN